MQRVFIVHGWDFNPSMHWYPWLKKQLEKKGFTVNIPAMPNTSQPHIDAWVSHLKNVVGKLDHNTHFVGHSIGCQTIMRFLEQDTSHSQIGTVVFVAGWLQLDNLEGEEVKAIAQPWIDTPINFHKIKQKIHQLIVFLSSNEPYGHIQDNERDFKEKLGAKVTILQEKGHFTEDDRVTELPEVLQALIHTSK